MRWHPLVCCLALLPLGGAGCARPSAALPPVAEVAKARVTVRQSLGDAGPQAPCDVTLSERPDIAEVMGWLQGIDWSQRGTDLTVATVPTPDGSIAITTKGGASYDFGFYWDGGFVDGKANRLIRGGDMAKLRQIVQRVCK
jgi:hypothetical protein